MEGIYGSERLAKIRAAKLLVVGAGGIGCEILKNLAFAGFTSIELIDLDTIDVSNLNRQFLFRPHHVGMSKAIVAAAATKEFNPAMNIIAHHDNVKNPSFDVRYIKKFTCVLNALDNIDARRHVNRLCLAAEVPLVDSGTTGYVGQVMPIQKGTCACYECTPKPTQKVYPICTIRSTPDKPVHCIVWAKECFKLIFGNTKESMLYEDETASGDTSTYMGLVPYPEPHSRTIDTVLQYATALMTALFDTEMQKRIGMGVYKNAKFVPFSLAEDVLIEAATRVRSDYYCDNNVSGDISKSSTSSLRGLLDAKCSVTSQSGWEEVVLPITDCVAGLLHCLMEVCIDDRAEHIGSLSFDKDDSWTMRFVCFASNVRSHLFGIPMQSYHDAKGVAGNIIPAIATTNAIVAGIQILQAIEIITGPTAAAADTPAPTPSTESGGANSSNSTACCMLKHTYVIRKPTRRGYFLEPVSVEEPNPSCYVCGTAQLTLQVDTNTFTLGDFVQKVVKGKLGFSLPSVMMNNSFLYEEGDGADEELAENLELILSQCPAGGIKGGSIVAVEDFSQKLELQIIIVHRDQKEFEDLPKEDPAAIDLFIVEGVADFERRQVKAQEEEASNAVATAVGPEDEVAGAAALSTKGVSAGSATGTDDGNGIIILDSLNTQGALSSASSSSATDGRTAAVKRKRADEDDADIVFID